MQTSFIDRVVGSVSWTLYANAAQSFSMLSTECAEDRAKNGCRRTFSRRLTGSVGKIAKLGRVALFWTESSQNAMAL
jgi:hypothetical protein